MPMRELLNAMDPPPPPDVLAATDDLRYRDFMTVALVVPEENGFPDNWIYIHDPAVRVGRVQNFGQWSPFMVKEGRTCLGLEFFVNEGDDMWTKADADLVEQGKRELEYLGLVDAWTVNVEDEYHEEHEGESSPELIESGGGERGTGREAPLLPRPETSSN